MPNLTGLGLQNFRTFADKQGLEFAPITLITGANNSGKSSILKAIQFLIQNLKEGEIKEELNFGVMKHELGGLKRTLNKKLSDKPKNDKLESLFSQIQNIPECFGKESNKDGIVRKPVFNSESDLVFSFPIKIGGGRKIDATLELRYSTSKVPVNSLDTKNKDRRLWHSIKSIGILYGEGYIHWSSIIGNNETDEGLMWEIHTSIDLKQLLELLRKPVRKEKYKNIKPHNGIEHYLGMNLWEKKQEGRLIFDFPFFRNENDGYEKFGKLFEKGKSLFSDYSLLSKEDKAKYQELEQNIFDDLILGYDISEYALVDSFKKDTFSRLARKVYEKIESIDSGQEIKEQSILHPIILPNSPNTKLYDQLMSDIESDFTKSVRSCLSKFQNIYSLPTLRGKSREWFIDEQDGDSIQIVKEYASIYLDSYKDIKSFIDFWIGKGEIEEGNKVISKGFNIGEGIEIIRSEDIGLTRIFLKNFDGSKTSLVDLGYGISQLLPIIMKIVFIASKHRNYHEDGFHDEYGEYVSRFYYYTPSTLLIEEPEANLHPALQSKLAELFIDAGTRFNIQFIVETHNEYLIYKLQEYIGKKIIAPDDVAMYYLHHPDVIVSDSSKKYVNRVEIKDDGSIDYERYFGKGFFDEQTNLKLSLLNIQRNNFLGLFNEMKERFHEGEENIPEEKQFEELSRLIDKHFKKLDFRTHRNRVKTEFPSYTKFQENTKGYLATAYHLMSLYDDDNRIVDYAPAIIQFGRAIECEFAHLFECARNYILSLHNYSDSWKEKKLYKREVSSLSSSQKNEFRDYISSNKISFGNMKHVLNLMRNEQVVNLNQVKLLKAFNDYLENDYFNDWTTVKNKMSDLKTIVDDRNEAAHTYGATQMTQQKAIEYKALAEPLLEVWSRVKK